MKKSVAAIAAAVLIVIAVIVCGRVFTVQSVEERFDVRPAGILPGELTRLSGIEFNSGILTIDENEVIKKVEGAYADRSVDVVSVERVFPNKVIIHAEERVPLAAVSRVSGGYALCDKDFQLQKFVDELPDKMISLTGMQAESTFNTPVFSAFRDILYAFHEAGYPFYALPGLIDEINFNDYLFTVRLSSGISFSLKYDNEISFRAALGEYCSSI